MDLKASQIRLDPTLVEEVNKAFFYKGVETSP